MANFKVPNWMEFKDLIFTKFSQNPGKMMAYAVTLSMATSCFAQVLSVMFNKKIDKKQKKFLIPQEIADGVINTISSLFVIGTMAAVGKKLVSTGKWSNAAIRNIVEKEAKDVKMGDIATNLEKTFIDKNNEKVLEDFYHVYDSFKNGIATIATTIGAVISCNIVTPILRNAYAAGQQKKSIEKQQLKNPATIASVNSQNDSNYRRMYTLPMNNGGSMKI